MRVTRIGIIGALLVFFTAQVQAETVDGLTLHIEKLSGKAIRVYVGDYVSTTSIIALATQKGIVVIDTTGCHGLDAKLRQVIARELGRNDFKYLINTHEHGDHTYGNQAYADCEIIAQEKCAAGMKSGAENWAEVAKWYENRIAQLGEELKKADGNSEAAKKLQEELSFDKVILRDRGSFKLTPPTKTFTDQMKLDMGDMTLELYYAGGIHSASDIFILVPEEGLLLTGDVMADKWLSDRPGCLATFMIRPGVERNVPLLLKNWESLIARKDEIKRYFPGHWNGELSFEGFKNRYNYVKKMYAWMEHEVQSGKKFSEIEAELALDKKFPELVDSPGFYPERHATSIRTVWCEVTGAKSAAEGLGKMIEKAGIEEAIKKMKALRAAETNDFYFDEAEFNGLGYRLINEKKLLEAIAVFKLNVEMYPESWNVYDSLAEGYMVNGEKELAIKFYNKSIEMNPDNENGKKMLEKIKGEQK
jgi:glyoxylase-like metal-dependent hydrolase (beta-lactamase superfamily II)